MEGIDGGAVLVADYWAASPLQMHAPDAGSAGDEHNGSKATLKVATLAGHDRGSTQSACGETEFRMACYMDTYFNDA